MKKMMLSFMVLAACTAAFSQDNRYNREYNNSNSYNAYGQTPTKVQRAWERDHQNSVSPSWQKESRHWDAHYTDPSNNRTVDQYYNRRGRVVDTHTEWDRRDVPSGLENNVWDRYHTRDYRVTRIDRPNNQSFFQILLNLGGNSRTVYYDEQGNEVRYRDRH